MAYAERSVPGSDAVLWSASGAASTWVLPDGCLDVLWTQDPTVPYGLLVAGPDRRAWTSGATGTMVGLRLAPGTGPAVLGVPAYALTGRRVPLVELWPAARVRRFAELLHRDPERLTALIELTRGADPIALRVAGLLAAGSPVGLAAAEVGLSARQLHRRSLAAYGYGPKTLGRILRLQRALRIAGSGASWALVAAESGYADQAHLARDVRDLAGTTLGGLVPHLS